MTVTVEVPPSIEAKLAADAAQEGLPLPDYISRVLARLVESRASAGERRASAAEFDAFRRMREARDAMEPLDIPIRELIEEGRER